MNTPIPLRPSLDALRESALTSIAKACVYMARNAGKSDRPKLGSDRLAEMLVTRAPTSPTKIADAAALAHVAYYFIASLVPTSAAAAVIARSLQLSFDNAAEICVPGLTLPLAAWVGEGNPIAVQQGTSSASTLLTPFKLATILTLSNEMLIHSNAEAMMKMVLAENVAPTLDNALFNAAAGVPGQAPPGILNNIPALTASTGTGLDGLVADIAAITRAVAPVAGGSPPILICAPEQYVAMHMLPVDPTWPVYMSATLPSGTVIGVAPAGLATVIETPRIEMVSAAAVHMNTQPSDIVISPSTVAAPVKSAFQTDSQFLRFILPCTWALRSPQAVAWVQNTKW